MQTVSEAQKLDAIIRHLGVAEIRRKRGLHIGLGLLLLFKASTSRVLRSWYWHSVWLEFKGKDFWQMWSTTDRGDWLLWFCAHMIDQPGWPSHQEVVLASCQCARLALGYIRPEEQRSLKAIETAEAWAQGDVTLDKVRCAGHAADYTNYGDDLAYLAAQAAYSAAWAAYAMEDGDCFRMAQAASGAASWVAMARSHELLLIQVEASNFSPVPHAAMEKVERATLRQCADIVRGLLDVPKFLTTEFTTLQRPRVS